MKYKVIVTSKKTGNKATYIYEGDGEYQGIFESVEQRIARHFKNDTYEVIEIK